MSNFGDARYEEQFADDEAVFLSALRNGDPVRDFLDEGMVHELYEKAIYELRYLRYFFEAADFGPAHSDVIEIINEGYEGTIPPGYAPPEEGDDDY